MAAITICSEFGAPKNNLVVDSKWEERYPLPVVQSVKEVMNLYKFYSIFSHGSYESEGEPVNNTY